MKKPFTTQRTAEPADHQLNQYTTTAFDTRQYDRNGNLIGINVGLATERRVAYDYRNRMVAHTNTATGVPTTYAYDALDRRIQKIVAGVTPQTTHFFYHGWQEIAEQDADAATQVTYVYGIYIDEALNFRRGDSKFFYHSDQLYNTLALSADDGTVVERLDYDDYGRVLFLSESGMVIPRSFVFNSLSFTGRRLDTETDFVFYRTRHLDSEAGRFTSRDTVGTWEDDANLGNSFTYIWNNPLRTQDPYGSQAQEGWPEVIEIDICFNDPFCGEPPPDMSKFSKCDIENVQTPISRWRRRGGEIEKRLRERFPGLWPNPRGPVYPDGGIRG